MTRYKVLYVALVSVFWGACNKEEREAVDVSSSLSVEKEGTDVKVNFVGKEVELIGYDESENFLKVLTKINASEVLEKGNVQQIRSMTAEEIQKYFDLLNFQLPLGMSEEYWTEMLKNLFPNDTSNLIGNMAMLIYNVMRLYSSVSYTYENCKLNGTSLDELEIAYQECVGFEYILSYFCLKFSEYKGILFPPSEEDGTIEEQEQGEEMNVQDDIKKVIVWLKENGYWEQIVYMSKKYGKRACIELFKGGYDNPIGCVKSLYIKEKLTQIEKDLGKIENSIIPLFMSKKEKELMITRLDELEEKIIQQANVDVMVIQGLDEDLVIEIMNDLLPD